MDFYHEHIFEFSESLHKMTNCVRFIFLSYKVSILSCVQSVLENGDLHPIKTNALFKKPCVSNVSLVDFWKVPWSAKSPSQIMRKTPWAKSIHCVNERRICSQKTKLCEKSARSRCPKICRETPYRMSPKKKNRSKYRAFSRFSKCPKRSPLRPLLR
jgi:hypothetical protein